MRSETKQHLHFGVNFILAPLGPVTPSQQLQFQQLLASEPHQIAFDAVQKQDTAVAFVRQSEPLEVRVGPVGAGAPLVGQLVVTAPKPDRGVEDFITDVEMIVEVFQRVWNQKMQVLRRDCTVRHLYAVAEAHAFEFLWERRLHQPADSVEAFGRPILGGGLRFVMPPRPDVADDPQVELKIESLLVDARQLFVEASFVWGAPLAEAELRPKMMLESVEHFLNNDVQRFILST